MILNVIIYFSVISDNNYSCSSYSEKCKSVIENAVSPIKELESHKQQLAKSIMDNIFKSAIEDSTKDWLIEKTYDTIFDAVVESVRYSIPLKKYVFTLYSIVV